MIAGGNHTSASCREAAKGVTLVTLSCNHSTNHTPSVRPFGLPAPPSGSQERRCEFAWGFIKPQVPTATPQPLRRQLPVQGRFSRCPLWGWCSAQRIKIVMIAGGNHTSASCRDSGKRGVVGVFESLPFIEPHPLSQAVRPASSPIGEPRNCTDSP